MTPYGVTKLINPQISATKELCSLNFKYFVIAIGQSHVSPNAPVPYPTYTIQNRNVHITVMNGALWDMEQVHCAISEFDLFI